MIAFRVTGEMVLSSDEFNVSTVDTWKLRVGGLWTFRVTRSLLSLLVSHIPC